MRPGNRTTGFVRLPGLAPPARIGGYTFSRRCRPVHLTASDPAIASASTRSTSDNLKRTDLAVNRIGCTPWRFMIRAAVLGCCILQAPGKQRRFEIGCNHMFRLQTVHAKRRVHRSDNPLRVLFGTRRKAGVTKVLRASHTIAVSTNPCNKASDQRLLLSESAHSEPE